MPTDPFQRRLAAILVADVAGYSRLMGEDEEGTLAALTAHRTELIEPCIAEHRGRVVKTMGDGLLVEFASVVDAVKCAVAFQEGMAVRNSDTPDDRRMDFRIGVNLGDVIVEGDDIHGDGVNVAARLEGLAEPGGVVVSGTVHEHVRGKLDFGFDDLGPQEVKNISTPVRAFRVTLGGVSAAPNSAPLPLPDKPSIAVLPFDNMSGDPEQAAPFRRGRHPRTLNQSGRNARLRELGIRSKKNRHLVRCRPATFAFKTAHRAEPRLLSGRRCRSLR